MPERPRIRPGQAAPAWAETWKPGRASRLLDVPHDHWAASSLGNVRTVDRTLASGRRVGGKVLTQRPDKDGYPTVKLGGKPVRVGVLVQLAWAGLPQVMHLDDDRGNSRPGNLAWGSKVVNEGMKRKRGREEGNGSEAYRPFPPVTPVTGPSPLGPVSLREAVEARILHPGTTLGALRVARHRKNFPSSVGERGTEYVYDPAALIEWDMGRR